jgi:tellurite methyltransferase
VSDQARWNERYLSHTGPRGRPRPWLVDHAALLPAPGRAVDGAMGLGGSAGWLVERGWRVLGADISDVAVRQAKARWPALWAVVADLEHFPLPPAAFELALNFYYLDRALWPAYRRALRPGGLFFMETFVRSPASEAAGLNPAHLLAPGELRAAFADWDVLDYREALRDPRADDARWVASLVARRP